MGGGLRGGMEKGMNIRKTPYIPSNCIIILKKIHRSSTQSHSLRLEATTAQAIFSVHDLPLLRVVMLQPNLRDSPTFKSRTKVFTFVFLEKPGSM